MMTKKKFMNHTFKIFILGVLVGMILTHLSYIIR